MRVMEDRERSYYMNYVKAGMDSKPVVYFVPNGSCSSNILLGIRYGIPLTRRFNYFLCFKL